MASLAELRSKRESILACAERNGAIAVRIFGSVARGEAREGSDVDFLVRFAPHCTLLDHIGLTDDLATLLNTKVDVVDEGGLSPHIRDDILHDAVPL